jgi:hypothetical protein
MPPAQGKYGRDAPGFSFVDMFIFCSIWFPARKMRSPTAPPRYAFRLEDLRVFHLVMACCHACAHKALIPNATVLQGRPGHTRLMSLEKQLRCGKCGARGRASLEVVPRPRD